MIRQSSASETANLRRNYDHNPDHHSNLLNWSSARDKPLNHTIKETSTTKTYLPGGGKNTVQSKPHAGMVDT